MLSKKFMKGVEYSLDKSKKPSRYSFSELPDEIVIIILRNLDLKSLCRVSRVNKRFNNLAQDRLLYTSLNLKPYCAYINAKVLRYLAPRCKYLRQLDLSLCCRFTVPTFKEFLDTCGSLLTHLRLNYTRLNDTAILKISTMCKNLKELDLRNCHKISNDGFSYLENLEFLEHLSFFPFFIETETLCKILRRNKRMRHLRLEGDRIDSLNGDKVAMELRNSCPDLETACLSPITNLTLRGINALADCKNLREVKFGCCVQQTYGDSFQRLFSSCQHLEKIFYNYGGSLTERDLRALTSCKDLKHLSFIYAPSLSPEICHAIFMNCPKLEEINFKCCDNITDCLIHQWRQKYPHITYKIEHKYVVRTLN